MPCFDNYVVFWWIFQFVCLGLVIYSSFLIRCVRACVCIVSTKRFCDVGHLSKRAGIRHAANQLRLIEHTKDILDRLYGREECQVKNGRTEADILGHRRFILFWWSGLIDSIKARFLVRTTLYISISVSVVGNRRWLQPCAWLPVWWYDSM